MDKAGFATALPSARYARFTHSLPDKGDILTLHTNGTFSLCVDSIVSYDRLEVLFAF